MLLNFETGVFAVSDSSDRAPGQSRAFLLQFDHMVSRSSKDSPDRTFRTSEIPGIAEEIKHGCEKIMEEMLGPASCTFTGVVFRRTERGMAALLFHTGDSRMYAYDPAKRSLSSLAVNNFWMIGRTLKLYQTAELRVQPGSIFILATDGVGSGTSESAQRHRIAAIASCGEVEDIPERVMLSEMPARELRDDAAMIALSTRDLQPVKARIIMGGTTAQEEREYTERYGFSCSRDSYMRLPKTSSRIDHVF